MLYDKIPTEQADARFENLDMLDALGIARLMNAADARAHAAVGQASREIAALIELAAGKLALGGRIIYMGAGTSGRLGVLDASECPPTFGVDPGQVVGIIAGGDGALRRAVEGAEDDAELGAEDARRARVSPIDVVIGISASGSAGYLLGALGAARELGASTASLTCNPLAAIHAHADICISMPTGAEVLSGSTRLCAGTATKMALNMISTGAMALRGKVYKNLMVDMRATNAKLKDRAVRIVMRALGVNRECAARAIANADGDLKCAIVMGAAGVSLCAAVAALDAEDGFVRRAVARLAGSGAPVSPGNCEKR